MDDIGKCLGFDPFEGDFGNPGDRTFRDRIATARKAYECSHCGGAICIGDRHRSRIDKVDGEIMSFRWCTDCCAVMAGCEADAQTEEELDQRDAYEERWEAKIAQREINRALRANQGGAAT